MTWSLFWYIKTALAWVLALTGALWWGKGHSELYVFVLSLTLAVTAIALSRINLEAVRRRSWRTGWDACLQAMQAPDEESENVRRIGRR